MTALKLLSPDETIAEIRRLYFRTTHQTIQSDLARALSLLKSLASEEQRERATVYMEGMHQMRSDWQRATRRATRSSSQGRERRTRGRGKRR